MEIDSSEAWLPLEGTKVDDVMPQMHFHWDSRVFWLFHGLHSTSVGPFIGGLIVSIAMCLIYETSSWILRTYEKSYISQKRDLLKIK
jgi:hypothetical protein